MKTNAKGLPPPRRPKTIGWIKYIGVTQASVQGFMEVCLNIL